LNQALLQGARRLIFVARYDIKQAGGLKQVAHVDHFGMHQRTCKLAIPPPPDQSLLPTRHYQRDITNATPN
jgi:hypothetical protein